LNTYLRADPPCLKYEYIKGGNLVGLMSERSARGELTPRFATKIIYRFGKSLAIAHHLKPAIVLSDLKPANILVQSNADDKVALLVADLGIGGIAVAQVIHKDTSRPAMCEQTGVVLGVGAGDANGYRGRRLHPAGRSRRAATGRRRWLQKRAHRRLRRASHGNGLPGLL